MSELSISLRRFLEEKRFGVLATINRDGSPQQSVIWYELDGDHILMNTKLGRAKDRNMRRDPRVSLCIEDAYRWVTIRGKVKLIDDQAVAQADIRRLSIRYHNEEKAEQQMQSQFSHEHRVTILLPITGVTSEGI